MSKYLVSIDWLQVYCHTNLIDWSEEYTTRRGVFEVRKQNYSSPLWHEIYALTWRGRELATVCRRPRNQVIDQHGCTVKLANRFLYSEQWLDFLMEVLDILQLRYKGITRLDLCADCNELEGGRSVESFLTDFLLHQPLTDGHIIRSGSRTVMVNAKKDKVGGMRISGMRWGSPSSDVGVYCYNKTLEMLEVKHKPWICEAWKQAGLINEFNQNDWEALTPAQRERAIKRGDADKYIEKPVWRFELSIKGHAKDLIDLDSGELFRLDLGTVNKYENIERLFHYYANKYLDFRINTGQSRLRDYEKMVLFKPSGAITKRPINVNLYADTGRTEKVCANLLEKLYETYSDVGELMANDMGNVLSFLRVISGVKWCTTRAKKQADYLNYIKSHKRLRDDYDFYLDYLTYCRDIKADIDPYVSRACIDSLIEAVRDYDYRNPSE